MHEFISHGGTAMTVLTLILIIAALGVAAYFIPMIPFIDDFFKKLLRWVCIGAAVVILLVAIGVVDALSTMSVRIFGR